MTSYIPLLYVPTPSFLSHFAANTPFVPWQIGHQTDVYSDPTRPRTHCSSHIHQAARICLAASLKVCGHPPSLQPSSYGRHSFFLRFPFSLPSRDFHLACGWTPLTLHIGCCEAGDVGHWERSGLARRWRILMTNPSFEHRRSPSTSPFYPSISRLGPSIGRGCHVEMFWW